jgi:hypothetical protein
VARTVLLAAIVAILNQTSPALAQDSHPRAVFSEPDTGPKKADRVPVPRGVQMMPMPHVHRNVSLRRVALGALIGGAAGAALGYGLASNSCGASASAQECRGYGRLGAVVAGGASAALGVHIALGSP